MATDNNVDGDKVTAGTGPEETTSSTFTNFDVIFIIGGIGMYIADVITDLVVGTQYLKQGNILWSTMTFVFVLLPSLILQCFSFRWFLSDLDKNKTNGCVSVIKNWWQWLVTHILQVGAIKRYVHILKLGLRSRKNHACSKKVIVEYRDITMLCLLEAFLESAPQLVLQVYIMVESDKLYWLTAASAIVSLCSLALSLETYHKALRESLAMQDETRNITYYGVVLRIVWRLFTITARVIAMVLFASIYKWWIFVLAAAHWAIMTVWILWQATDFCETKFEEVLFDAVMGVVHIFCFFNLKEGRTRHRALTFYTIIFIENTMMAGMWYLDQESHEKRYGIPALAFVWGGFFLGIFFMSLYYRFCHPRGKLLVCLLEDKGKRPKHAKSNGETSNVDTVGPSSNNNITPDEREPYRVKLFAFKERRPINKNVLPVANNSNDSVL